MKHIYRSSQIWLFEWFPDPAVVPLGLAVLPLASDSTPLASANGSIAQAKYAHRYNRWVLAVLPLRTSTGCAGGRTAGSTVN